jgi:hypothetical protein
MDSEAAKLAKLLVETHLLHTKYYVGLYL